MERTKARVDIKCSLHIGSNGPDIRRWRRAGEVHGHGTMSLAYRCTTNKSTDESMFSALKLLTIVNERNIYRLAQIHSRRLQVRLSELPTFSTREKVYVA